MFSIADKIFFIIVIMSYIGGMIWLFKDYMNLDDILDVEKDASWNQDEDIHLGI